jgi:hypothetical protein
MNTSISLTSITDFHLKSLAMASGVFSLRPRLSRCRNNAVRPWRSSCPTKPSATSAANAANHMLISSLSGLTGRRPACVTTRPCRAHHPIADVGLIGGGQIPTPGEVSRAHHGVLFLDELPEFKRHVLEVLRQPLEKGITQIQSPARPRPRQVGRACSADVCPAGPTPNAVNPSR